MTVWSYPAMLYVGLVLGVFARNAVAHANGIDPLRVYLATLILIVPALAGARLLYIAAEWDHYRTDLRQIWNRKDGGYIMYGGLPAALLVSVPLLRALRLPIAGFWDVAIFTILVGMCFTRIGCLLNGCWGGRTTDSWFGVYLPERTGALQKRIPAQALEGSVGGDFAYACAGSATVYALYRRVIFADLLRLRLRPDADAVRAGEQR
jgi:phosphatidylglycerol---prolipoprotein diacylglyceryl transferase